jgi:hypothetical protein
MYIIYWQKKFVVMIYIIYQYLPLVVFLEFQFFTSIVFLVGVHLIIIPHYYRPLFCLQKGDTCYPTLYHSLLTTLNDAPIFGVDAILALLAALLIL